MSLDKFCTRHALAPEIIKIDVEGAEMEVLLGVADILRQYRPTIFFSVHPTELGLPGHSVEELRAVMHELGYKCRNMEGTPVGTLGFAEYLLEGIS